MATPSKDDEATRLRGVGRVLDSRWMMTVAVLAVLVAIAWALLKREPGADPTQAGPTAPRIAKVELLGVPPGARITLDDKVIKNDVFGVSPDTRHAVEVKDPSGRTWRQVFLANGTLSLVVELREDFVEVPVQPTKD